MSRKVSTFVVDNFLLRFESGSVAIRIFESAYHIWVEAKLGDGVVRIGGQDTRDVFVPLIITDPAEVG